MSLWWLWSTDTTSVGDPEENYPSLWSGGVTWESAAADTGTQGYWQTATTPDTGRTGQPDISIAIGGAPVTNTIRSASWQLGRDGGLFSTLSPASASFEVEGSVTFTPMDEVVIGVMSDTTDEHSSSLWVGYVDTISETNETSGRIVTSVSCVDIMGALGQAAAPVMDVDGGIDRMIEQLVAEAGLVVVVEAVDPTNPDGHPILGASDGTGTVLGVINQFEQAANALVVMRGGGRLGSLSRSQEYAPTAITLNAAAGLSEWTTQRSPSNVVNEWREDDEIISDSSEAAETSRERYGVHTLAPDLSFASVVGGPVELGAYLQLRLSEILLEPIEILSGASLYVTDLSQSGLFLNPLDWVELDSTTYVVMSVSHQVEPGRRWSVSITGDPTLPILQETL